MVLNRSPELKYGSKCIIYLLKLGKMGMKLQRKGTLFMKQFLSKEVHI